MAHEGNCSHDSHVDPGSNFTPFGPEATVGEVARGQAGALEILKELGINHCCGAHLTLREAAYPPVLYIPRADADLTQFARTGHATYCPYKGAAAYYSLPAGGERSVNAVWTYEAPFDAVAAIRGHLAFYPDRVDAIEELA